MLNLAHVLHMESAGLYVMRGVLIGGNRSTVMLHVHCLLSPSFVFCAPICQVFYRNSIVRWNARVTNACSDANFINQDGGATDTS